MRIHAKQKLRWFFFKQQTRVHARGFFFVFVFGKKIESHVRGIICVFRHACEALQISHLRKINLGDHKKSFEPSLPPPALSPSSFLPPSCYLRLPPSSLLPSSSFLSTSFFPPFSLLSLSMHKKIPVGIYSMTMVRMLLSQQYPKTFAT